MILSIQQFRVLQITCLSTLLAACGSNDNFSDLQGFVASVKERPAAQVEPVPIFVPYEGFIYSAASQRSPFDMPLIINENESQELALDVQPDFDRQRELLESQSLSELKMVGMLFRQETYEALIEDGFGEVHRVGVGSYLGRNYGRVQAISETQMNIREIVPSGNDGWVERPQMLTLQ
ncbi:MAG: type IV pilus assembly protein PilP [Pseudohongiellaceae bacterium]|jgi:type IV pilus assembly protein PilP